MTTANLNPPCADCGEPGIVGLGAVPVWLCAACLGPKLRQVGEALERLLEQPVKRSRTTKPKGAS